MIIPCTVHKHLFRRALQNWKTLVWYDGITIQENRKLSFMVWWWRRSFLVSLVPWSLGQSIENSHCPFERPYLQMMSWRDEWKSRRFEVGVRVWCWHAIPRFFVMDANVLRERPVYGCQTEKHSRSNGGGHKVRVDKRTKWDFLTFGCILASILTPKNFSPNVYSHAHVNVCSVSPEKIGGKRMKSIHWYGEGRKPFFQEYDNP